MSSSTSTRKASHSGSWYSSNSNQLNSSLTNWLNDVASDDIPPSDKVCQKELQSDGKGLDLPVKGCRAIIAPHAGYSYSGPAAAYAYKCIDTTGIKRVFILGPSHHVYLDGCALTKCERYDTPIGELFIDKEINSKLHSTNQFSQMDLETDEDEHSIEMHLPYIRKVFENQNITIVPILVGAITTSKETKFGELLAPYLADESSLFVVSSDFCHWGTRFSYTQYSQTPTSPSQSLSTKSSISIYNSPNQFIHQSIRSLDEDAINSISTTNSTAKESKREFAGYLKKTRNTVCGRHPIGVLLGCLEKLEEDGKKFEIRFTRYEFRMPYDQRFLGFLCFCFCSLAVAVSGTPKSIFSVNLKFNRFRVENVGILDLPVLLRGRRANVNSGLGVEGVKMAGLKKVGDILAQIHLQETGRMQKTGERGGRLAIRAKILGS